MASTMTDDEVVKNEENDFISLWSIECFQISPADAETSIRLDFFSSSGFDCQGEDNHNSQV
jgi:hypothetical protein